MFSKIQIFQSFLLNRYERFQLYMANATNQENQIRDVRNRLEDMDVQFQIVEMQQQQYFDMEQTILEEIFSATDNAWHWNFEHRNASDTAINDAFGSMGDLITQMQQQQLELMLKEAQASVTHFEEVVQKYETQIKRYKVKLSY